MIERWKDEKTMSPIEEVCGGIQLWIPFPTPFLEEVAAKIQSILFFLLALGHLGVLIR